MNIAVALAPVLLLLVLLQLLDSFKLVPLRSVIVAIAAGAVAAVACLSLHDAFLARVHVDLRLFARYVAPVTEELCKAAFIALLLWRNRVGFLVDAAVLGFAVGAGFALFENIDYLRHLTGAGLDLWMVAKTLRDRRAGRPAHALLPALAAAVAIHSGFNHLPLPPLAMTAVLLLVLPLVVIFVFQRSERTTREWIGAGLDLDLELLDLVRSEHFTFTRFGRYLQELRARFGGPVVADMFCLLRLQIELSVQAKAMLLARESGLELPAATSDLSDSFEEIEYLQSSIGRTGLLALKPLQITSGRDLWHRHLLASGGARRRASR
jgi:hypothetical protein